MSFTYLCSARELTRHSPVCTTDAFGVRLHAIRRSRGSRLAPAHDPSGENRLQWHLERSRRRKGVRTFLEARKEWAERAYGQVGQRVATRVLVLIGNLGPSLRARCLLSWITSAVRLLNERLVVPCPPRASFRGLRLLLNLDAITRQDDSSISVSSADVHTHRAVDAELPRSTIKVGCNDFKAWTHAGLVYGPSRQPTEPLLQHTPTNTANHSLRVHSCGPLGDLLWATLPLRAGSLGPGSGGNRPRWISRPIRERSARSNREVGRDSDRSRALYGGCRRSFPRGDAFPSTRRKEG